MNITAFINGDIWTMDSSTPRYQGVLIKDNKILYIGDSQTVLAEGKKHAKPEVIDLKGKTLLPGFIDAHLHMAWQARTLLQIDCFQQKSIPEIVALLKKERINSTGWIQGFGYDDNKLAEKRHPTRQELDQARSDIPIILNNASGHMVVVNSKALEILHIDENTPDPPDGKIVRDSSGRPTGLMLEGAQALILYKIPPYSLDEMVDALTRASVIYSEHGLTSVHELGAGDLAIELEAYEKAYLDHSLKVRTNLYHPFYEIKKMIRFMEDPDSIFNRLSRIESEWLRFKGVKFYLDGSLIGRTAAVKVPYKNTAGDCGFLVMTPKQLEEMVSYAHRNGFQIGIHAIGEVAVDICAEVYEKVAKDHPRADYRHRIEHCGLVNEQSLNRMRKAGIIAPSQPIFIDDFGDGFKRCMEDSELKKVYAYKSMLDHGITVAFSTDSPVSSFDPLLGIRAAVTRRTYSGDIFEEQERVTLEEAVHCYTVNGAYASFEENIKGKLAPGYLADMVVLSGPLSIETLGDISVEKTYLNGQLVYKK
jgi:predicted amidohydrolase YtcJ